MKKFDQAWRIKRLLAEMGENISSLSRKLNRPFGSVANNIYGYRASSQLQREIADFLGRPVAELFEAPAPPLQNNYAHGWAVCSRKSMDRFGH